MVERVEAHPALLDPHVDAGVGAAVARLVVRLRMVSGSRLLRLAVAPAGPAPASASGGAAWLRPSRARRWTRRGSPAWTPVDSSWCRRSGRRREQGLGGRRVLRLEVQAHLPGVQLHVHVHGAQLGGMQLQ